MKSLLLDGGGDLVFFAGNFAIVENDEELAQSIRLLIKTAKEEWFLDEEAGMDRDPFQTKPFSEDEARDSLIEAILQDERVAAVEDITFAQAGRTLSVTLSILKEDGEALQLEGVEVGA